MEWSLSLFAFLIVGTGIVKECKGQDYSEGQYKSSTPLYGITYTPFALDLETMCLPNEQVLADLQVIKNVADHIRTYNLINCTENLEVILKFCKENQIKVVLGMHLSENLENNEAEMSALPRLVESYGNILDAIVVGNECLGLKKLSFEQLLAYIYEAKTIVALSGHNIPISTGEGWPILESILGRRLVRATDFVCLNMETFWEGWEITCRNNTDEICNSAGNYVQLKAEGLEEYFEKPVWICEAGWPTEGERCCEGRSGARDGLLAGPHISNTTTFLNELVEQGRLVQRPTFLRSMFDEDWQRTWSPCDNCEGLSTQMENPNCNTCEAEYYFGLYYANRTSKGIQLPSSP